MFYDLEEPMTFIADIHDVLAEDGVWHFEQSYLPLMLEANSYDTICHEHLLYLSMHDIRRILDASGFRIIDGGTHFKRRGARRIGRIDFEHVRLIRGPQIN